MPTIYTADISAASAVRMEVDTASIMASLGEQLRALRAAAGLTQTALASRVGVSQPTVSAVENGTPTTTDVLERWVQVCRGILRLEVSGSGRLGDALRAVAELPDDDLDRVERIARAMPAVPVETKEGITRALSAIAPRPPLR